MAAAMSDWERALVALTEAQHALDAAFRLVTECARLAVPPPPQGDGIASPEEWDELSAIEQMRRPGPREAYRQLMTPSPETVAAVAEMGRLPPDVRPNLGDPRLTTPIEHQCDRRGAMVPVEGEYRFTCLQCGKPQ